MKIGKNIQYFRLQKGASQQWLADAIGVSKMSISYFENDKRRPDIATVKRICSALDVSLEKFMAFSDGVTLSDGSFQKSDDKSDDLSATQKNAILAQIRYSAQRYYDACTIANVDCSKSALPIDKVPMPDSLVDAAAYMRKALDFPISGPVGNLTQILENKGVYVVAVKQDDSKVSTKGFFGYHAVSNKGFAVIAFNEEMTCVCQRMALAEGLAHLLFSDASEHQINNTANHFLLPGPDLIRELGRKRQNISFKEMQLVGKEYGVSGQCVVLRAREEGIITRETYSCIQNGKHYPADAYKNDELPVRLLQLVCRAYTDNLIGISKAAELLDTDVNHVLELFGGEENK